MRSATGSHTTAAAALNALEAARTGRDPFANAALNASHERIAELERELADDDDGAVAAPAEAEAGPEVGERIATLEQRRRTLEASLLALDAADPFAVEVALAQAEGDDTVDRVPSAEAQALADEWATLEARLRAGGPNTEAGPQNLADARRRLDEARVAVFEAERAVRIPDISREDAQALEDAHENVLSAQDRIEKRFAVAGRAAESNTRETPSRRCSIGSASSPTPTS